MLLDVDWTLLSDIIGMSESQPPPITGFYKEIAAVDVPPIISANGSLLVEAAVVGPPKFNPVNPAIKFDCSD